MTSAPIVTPPDFHFVSLNLDVALLFEGVKASVPIHSLGRLAERPGLSRSGCCGRIVYPQEPDEEFARLVEVVMVV